MLPSVAYALRRLRKLFAGLPRRAYLTYRYHGGKEFAWRVVTFPLRLTPFGARLGLAPQMSDPSAPARRWYAQNGRPVAIVIPTYGDPRVVARAVKSIRRTTSRERVRIIVADDGSPPEHIPALRALEGVELILGESQRGFAANCNRGIEAARPDEDVVLVNSDVIAHPGWLESLQHAAYEASAGITGARLLYPDGTLQFAGMVRNPYNPDWFDHRYRGRPEDLPEASVMQPTLAVTGACMYITRRTLDDVGLLDDGYEMAFEDVDYCLRAWERGHRVLYAPAAVLTHAESKTRGTTQGPRELRSQQRFWERWGDVFDRRRVTTDDGALKVIYVTKDTGVGGGHRVIFTHLNGLAERGHDVELWTLGPTDPDWFDLRVPVRGFADPAELIEALAPVDAIKVATWWETADWVFEATLLHGVPVYWVQDIETSYYRWHADRARVLASYRPEFTYFAGSEWIREKLLKIVPNEVTTFTPGIDLDRYRPLDGVERRDDVVLALGRSEPLKDFPLTRSTYQALAEPKPELWLFGIEPALADGLGPRATYIERPSDERVNELYNQATVLLQTSKHEGFCLPALEAMATGATVVCTDANGNRDFCRDGVNCLMPAERSPEALAAAVRRALDDPDLRARLAEAGRRTAAEYAWPTKLDALEAHYRELAERASSGAPVALPHR
jgi:GT2 family glycosyltransferase/glycosyltransferase involved in cell wall biosynthesis